MLRGAIQRPIAVSMLFAALLLIGFLSYSRLPVDLLPSITYPRLTVITTYDDIPAEDLERLVTQPIEEIITALSGVRGVTSRTREGISAITVEYEWGTQMDFANLHLREAIDRVAFRDDFPEAADRPVILRWDPTSRPVSILVLQGDDRIAALTELAREVVKPALEQEDGVSQAEVVGGYEREIRVEPDADKLAIYGIDIGDISAALARSNISFPGGKVKQGPLYLSLRIDGEFEGLEEIAATDIQRVGRSPIRIADVAQVLDTVKIPEGYTLLEDRHVVSLLIYKEPEANTIKVSERVDTALEVVKGDYGDFDYDFVYRDAEYVRESFSGLQSSLILGGGLAIGVLFLFLGTGRGPVWSLLAMIGLAVGYSFLTDRWPLDLTLAAWPSILGTILMGVALFWFFLRYGRSALVVALAIPISLIITFALLFFGGVKLNLMSLGGLSLAAGMLVDNAIVVLENIHRHLSLSREELETERHDATHPASSTPEARVLAHSAEKGASQVARPVLAATLTTIAVFFPVVYVPGIAGAFFRDQALSVTFSLLVSVAAALLLQPVLSARLLRVAEGPDTGLFLLFQSGLRRFHDVYHRVLLRALRNPGLAVVGLVVVLVAGGFLGSRLDRGFMPERSSGDLRVGLELPAGTPLEETRDVSAELAGWIAEDDAVAHVFTQVGQTQQTLAAMQDYTAPHTAQMRVLLKPMRGAAAAGERLQEQITRRLEAAADIQFVFREEGIGLGEMLSQGGSAFQMGVLAEDPLDAIDAADRVLEAVRGVDGLTDLNVDRVLGTPNVVVSLDREEVLRSGLNPDALAQELRARIAGVEATTFNEVEQRIDIAVRFPYEERLILNAALDSPVKLAGGRSVPLRSFLDIREERPVRELVRQNQRRMVTLGGDVQGRDLDEVWADAEAAVSALGLPDDVRIVEGGERKEIARSFRDLGMAMALAALLVYMILAAQFESFLDPLLIAAVIPIGMVGAAVAIGVSGSTVNILSLIGLVALLGIAVNDAIVKIDTIRRLREEGLDGTSAILKASSLRLRPILMTSVTTVLAMAPMAIGLGSGEQLQRPLAITIMGGLTLTTLLTLIYTPVLYQVAHRIPRPGRDAT